MIIYQQSKPKIVCFSIIVFCLAFIVSNGLAGTKGNFSFPQVNLGPQDRILILAPHPDDEVLGCAGVIQKAVAMKLPLRIVFLTYGDNNQWSFMVYRKRLVFMPGAVKDMGLVRHDEAIAAARVLGVNPADLYFLGYPDFSTLHIWNFHWGNSLPVKSLLTGARSVPYKNAFRFGAPYKGEEILNDLKTIIKQFRPTKIFVSHPADHNPDHRALYLFCRVALWDLEKEIRPQLYPYPIHYKRWPKPRGYYPDKRLFPPKPFQDEIPWLVDNLSPQEIKIKLSAIKAHGSQYKSSPGYLLSFIRANELFGDLPPVVLGPNIPRVLSPSRHQEVPIEMPEELTDTERAAFVGIEERSVNIEDGKLILSIKFSRPIAKAVEASVFVFGHRRDTAFKDMPKIHIKFGAVKYAFYDQNRKIPYKAIRFNQKARQITFQIPLKLLGDPERILTSTNTYLGLVPLDWTSWRILGVLQ